MKKILATLIAALMAFSMLIPVAAVNDVNYAVDTLNINESVPAQTIFETFGFLKTIYNAVHTLVHTLSEIFDFDCPFYHEKEDADVPDTPDTPDTPDNPDAPVDPVDPSEPVDDDKYDAIEITAAELAELLTGEIVDNCLTVELNNNYKVTDEWTSISYPVDTYLVLLESFTFEGNGHVIAGLTAPLFAGNVARNIKIKDLTIADSNIANGFENDLGRGAVVAYADHNVTSISLENCAVKNTTVSSDISAGSFVGYVAQNNSEFKNCTAKNVTLNATKSAGGIVGHFMTDKNKSHVIENCKVENCNFDGKYAGQIIGTANGDGELNITSCTFTGDACDPNRAFATVTVTND